MKKRTGVSMKELMLGEESYKKDSTSKTAKQLTSIPARQLNSKTAKHKTSKPVKQVKIKKVTYYIKNADLVKKLKILGVKKERDLSSLVTEAIDDLLKKYK
ncbi:hypothetical protein ES702_00337 [subsurface metagenome]